MRSRHSQIRRAAAVLGALSLVLHTFSCGDGSTPPIDDSECELPQGTTMGDEVTYREMTDAGISGHSVGIANIMERDLPDESGQVAGRLSARLVIRGPSGGEERTEFVFAGSVLAVGPDRYCVVGVESDGSGPGAITVRQLLTS